jgi:hypothetical protein
VLLARVDNSPRPGAVDQRDRKTANCEDLVRPETIVACPRHVIDIDHVGKAAEALIPESIEKREPSSFEHVTPGWLQT